MNVSASCVFYSNTIKTLLRTVSFEKRTLFCGDLDCSANAKEGV